MIIHATKSRGGLSACSSLGRSYRRYALRNEPATEQRVNLTCLRAHLRGAQVHAVMFYAND